MKEEQRHIRTHKNSSQFSSAKRRRVVQTLMTGFERSDRKAEGLALVVVQASVSAQVDAFVKVKEALNKLKRESWLKNKRPNSLSGISV